MSKINQLTDDQSHDLQDEIDHVLDLIDEREDEIIHLLSDVRDKIPCSCGEDNEE